MRFRNLHRNEEVILEIANDLYRETDPERASVRMLERLGEELGAERSYLFSARGEGFSNTHEWCADGISSQIESLQDMDYRLFERWLDLFGRGECVLIEDLDAIKGVVDPRELSLIHI